MCSEFIRALAWLAHLLLLAVEGAGVQLSEGKKEDGAFSM